MAAVSVLSGKPNFQGPVLFNGDPRHTTDFNDAQRSMNRVANPRDYGLTPDAQVSLAAAPVMTQPASGGLQM